MTLLFIFLLIISYLLGSLSSAIIVCQLAGLPDPRLEGSKNPGATNVLRLGGKKWAAIVLIGDVLKGVVAVALAKLLRLDSYFLGWIVLAAFLGHLYPIFFKFRGGKGVATAMGGLLMLSWSLGLICIGTWLLMAAIFRYSSLAALAATLVCIVVGFFFLTPSQYWPVLLMCFMLIGSHRSNIKKLVAGTEGKIGV